MGDSGDPHFAENYEDHLDGFGEDGLEDYNWPEADERLGDDSATKPAGLGE